jgi:hypothetical protein
MRDFVKLDKAFITIGDVFTLSTSNIEGFIVREADRALVGCVVHIIYTIGTLSLNSYTVYL